MLVDELEHEDQDDGEKDAVENLRQNAEADQRKVWDEDDGCSGGEEQGVEPVKEFCFAEGFVEAALEAETFADGVGGGQRKDRGGEERGVEEAGSEEDEGVVSGEGLHGSRSVGCVVDVADAVGEEGGGAGDDDEPGDDVGEDRAYDDVPA